MYPPFDNIDIQAPLNASCYWKIRFPRKKSSKIELGPLQNRFFRSSSFQISSKFHCVMQDNMIDDTAKKIPTAHYLFRLKSPICTLQETQILL